MGGVAGFEPVKNSIVVARPYHYTRGPLPSIDSLACQTPKFLVLRILKFHPKLNIGLFGPPQMPDTGSWLCTTTGTLIDLILEPVSLRKFSVNVN